MCCYRAVPIAKQILGYPRRAMLFRNVAGPISITKLSRKTKCNLYGGARNNSYRLLQEDPWDDSSTAQGRTDLVDRSFSWAHGLGATPTRIDATAALR